MWILLCCLLIILQVPSLHPLTISNTFNILIWAGTLYMVIKHGVSMIASSHELWLWRELTACMRLAFICHPGTIPSSIGNLYYLQNFWLGQNDLTGNHTLFQWQWNKDTMLLSFNLILYCVHVFGYLFRNHSFIYWKPHKSPVCSFWQQQTDW